MDKRTVYVFFAFAIILKLYKAAHSKKLTSSVQKLPGQREESVFRKMMLLTKKEWLFYRRLYPIAEKYRLHIIPKVRIGDIIHTKKSTGVNYDYELIKNRTVDFVLAHPNTLSVLLILEFEDRPKSPAEHFIDSTAEKIFAAAGIPFIRTCGTEGLDEQICGKLGISEK
ncbi:MAG: DUF2726 domain-containing protein [Ruminococcus sp.]|nr:DUF2726 domain-containing protein [Ruminococcus sp.]